MRRPRNPSRRALVAGGTASAAALAVPSWAAPPAGAAPRRLPNPFLLGVASGDPSPSSVVLWTRLATEPLAEDGRGGMPGRPFPVQWQIADDERFRRVIRAGTALARPAWAHSVHVEVGELRSGAEYFYRFRVQGHLSPVGRTLTTPDPATLRRPLTFGQVSCNSYQHGYFTAFRRLAEDHPDLVVHLGDYIYEYGDLGQSRDHAGGETITLADYRRRYAQYHSDPDLRAAHAIAPWLAIWDDHEIQNNWAGEHPSVPQDDFLARREAATRAYYENLPLRRDSVPSGVSAQLYRRVHWGALASFHMLDTRQFRWDQACGDGIDVDCTERLHPDRTILGAEQEAWLLDGLRHSHRRWDILGQQVWMAQMDYLAGPLQGFNMDAWDGYVTSRDRITRGWVEAGVRNPVVLTGDVHSHWAAEMKADWNDPTSATIGVELSCTSISSGRDGSETTPIGTIIARENPHVRFHHYRRGYIRHRLTAEELRSDYRIVPYVSRPGAPASTVASFVVEDGRPGLNSLAI